MKRFANFVFLILYLVRVQGQGNIIIQPGTMLRTNGATYLVLKDFGVVNNGSLQQLGSNDVIKFLGSIPSTISGNSMPSFSNVELSLSVGNTISLQNAIEVKNQLRLLNGNVNLNNSIIHLGSTGNVTGENETNRVLTTGTGYIEALAVLNAPNHANPGSLGAVFTSSSNFGNTIVRRGHQPQNSVSGIYASVKRYYDIIPVNNQQLGSSLQFYYLQAELNGNTESTLVLWKSANGQWSSLGAASRDPNSKFIQADGINAFSRITLANSPTVSQYLTTNTLLIPTGTTLNSGGVYLVLNNLNLINNGNFDQKSQNDVLKFTGNSEVIIAGSHSCLVNTLELAKANQTHLALASNVSIKRQIVFNGGFLNLNDQVVDLGLTADLVGEKEASRAFTDGIGYIQRQQNLNSPAAVNPGNLGATITSAVNLGLVTIKRGHKAQLVNNSMSILRYFDIIPTNNSNLNATLKFSYLDADLNGINENGLSLWKNSNNNVWIDQNFSSRSAATNDITRNNIADFSRWTLTTATEICNGIDDNANGTIDEGCIQLTCPANKTINTSPNSCTASVSNIDPVISPSLSPVSYSVTGATTANGSGSASGVSFNKGISTVTYTSVTDPTKTCSFTVTVLDVAAPSFTCPPDRNTALTNSCQIVIPDLISTLTGTDNCGSVNFSQLPLPGTAFNAVHDQHFQVTVTATDGNGNSSSCTATLTAKDVSSPVITSCPGPTVFCYNATNTYTISGLTGSDNCGTVNVSYVISGATSRLGNGADASGVFYPGISTIAWTASDGHGNSATCSTTVRVAKVDASIPDVYAVSSSIGAANTIYIGYGATSVTLNSQVQSSLSPNTFTYKWTTGSPSGPVVGTGASVTISPTTTTVYYLSMRDVNNCKPLQQITKQINVLNIQCGTGKVYVCEKQKKGSYATSCIAAIDKNINSLPTGSYLGPCAALTQAQYNRREVEEVNSLSVQVYPNPSKHSFTIKIRSADPQPVSISIKDALGRTVEKKTGVPANSTTLFGNKYYSGAYFVEILQGKFQQTIKVLKLPD